MNYIKLFEEFINEAVSMEAVYIHQIIGCGQAAAQHFIDDNNIDGKKLADYVKQNKDSREKYDVRDMIAGSGIGSDKKRREKFIKQFINESDVQDETVIESKIPDSWVAYDIKHEISKGQTLETLMISKLNNKDISAINAVKPYAMKINFFDVEIAMDKKPSVTNVRVDNYDLSKIGGSSTAYVITIKK